MTGRQPFRNGTGDSTVDIAGFGLAGKAVVEAFLVKQAAPAQKAGPTILNFFGK